MDAFLYMLPRILFFFMCCLARRWKKIECSYLRPSTKKFLLPHEYMISSRWLSSTFLSVTLVSACVGPVLAQDQLASSLCSLHLNWPVPPARLTTNDRWLQLRGQCLDRNARGRDSTRCLLSCNGKSGRKETQKSPEASLFDSATARSHQEGSWILDWRWCS